MPKPRLVVINDSSMISGGATKVAHACIVAAIQGGFDVGVLVGDDAANLATRYPGLRIEHLGQRPLRESSQLRDMAQKLYNREAHRAIRRLLEWAGPDATVHVHAWSQILSPAIFYALAEHEGRIIVTAHDFFLNCPNGGFIDYPTGNICTRVPMSASCLTTNCDKRNYGHKLWRAMRQALQNRVGPEFWSRVELILVYEEMARFLGDFPSRKRYTVRNFVSPFLSSHTEPWRNEEFVFLGRMTKEKGVDTLIAALERSGIQACLIGKGPLLAEAQARLPHCRVTGWIDDAELERIFARTRAVIFSSKMPEPYGLVAAEAITSGLPVLVSDSALIAHEITENGLGISFRSGDVDDLIAAMRRLQDDTLLRELALKARDYGDIALTRSAWEHTMNEIYRGAA